MLSQFSASTLPIPLNFVFLSPLPKILFFFTYTQICFNKTMIPDSLTVGSFVKVEHKVWNLIPHRPTVGNFAIMSMVEEMSLELSLSFSHRHPKLVRVKL